MAIKSKTEACNMALARIGAMRINSYESDQSEEAIACRLHFDHVNETLLRRHQWNFATGRADLTKLATPPDSEWAAAWQLPNDYVRLIRIVGGDVHNPVRSYAIEGRHLLTRGGGVAQIVYVTSATPVPYWDSLFVDALVLKLAAAINGNIIRNPEIAAACLKELEALALPAAQTADAREVLSGENFGPREMASKSQLVASRFRGSGGYMPRPSPPGA